MSCQFKYIWSRASLFQGKKTLFKICGFLEGREHSAPNTAASKGKSGTRSGFFSMVITFIFE